MPIFADSSMVRTLSIKVKPFMPTKLVLCALIALSALITGCDSDRSADFCANVCECSDPNGTDGCVGQCTQSIDSLESSNSGAPILSDECFACVDHNSCQIISAVCNSECATLIQALNGGQPQPGDPIDTN